MYRKTCAPKLSLGRSREGSSNYNNNKEGIEEDTKARRGDFHSSMQSVPSNSPSANPETN